MTRLYLIILFCTAVHLFTFGNFKADSLIIINNTKTVANLQYFDHVNSFRSITIATGSISAIPFEGCLSAQLSNDTKQKIQILCLNSDTIQINDIKWHSTTHTISGFTYAISHKDLHHLRSNNNLDIESIRDNLVAQLSSSAKKPTSSPSLLQKNLIYLLFDSYIFNNLIQTAYGDNEKWKIDSLGQEYLLQKADSSNSLYNTSLVKFIDFQYKNNKSFQGDIFEYITNLPTISHQGKEFLFFNSLNRLVARQKERFIQAYALYKESIYDPALQNHLFNIYISTVNTSTEKTMLLRYSDFKMIPIDQLYKEYLGKNIVYDFSASWCTPCLAGIPKLLKYSSKSPNTAYVIISVDDNINNWLPIIKEHKLSAQHNYFLIGGLKSEFAKFYMIETIPRYMHLDANGEVVNNNLNIEHQ